MKGFFSLSPINQKYISEIWNTAADELSPWPEIAKYLCSFFRSIRPLTQSWTQMTVFPKCSSSNNYRSHFKCSTCATTGRDSRTCQVSPTYQTSFHTIWSRYISSRRISHSTEAQTSTKTPEWEKNLCYVACMGSRGWFFVGSIASSFKESFSCKLHQPNSPSKIFYCIPTLSRYHDNYYIFDNHYSTRYW